jgi:hypothetical protein
MSNYGKYRSLYWWFNALVSQINHIFGIKRLLRKFKLIEKYTPADRLNLRMMKDGDKFYCKLVSKYPEYAWAKKYVTRELGFVVPALNSVLVSEDFGLHSFWCSDASIESCISLLSEGLPVMTTIRLKSGDKHSILLIGCNHAKKLFYVNDPLGDYFSNYKIMFGANVEFPFQTIQEINTGRPINISLSCHPNQSLIVRKILNKNALYSWP